MKEKGDVAKPLEIMVFGLDAICGGLVEDIATAQYNIHFVGRNRSCEFDCYDGVVVFQGVFERLQRSDGYLGSTEWITSDKDDLDRRYKESLKLIRNGGFVLLIQTRAFHDCFGGKDCRKTDLIKRLTNFHNVWRRDYDESSAVVSALKAELGDFCATYGRAYSYFSVNQDNDCDFLPLVKVGQNVVGCSFCKSIYVVPSMLPRLDDCGKYFSSLVEPIIAIHKKRRLELPEWAAAPFFDDEKERHAQIAKCEKKIAEEKKWLEGYARCKRVLFSTGEELVTDVAWVLGMVSGVKVDTTDEKKEDCKLIDGDGRVLALVEVKGVNGNLKLSHVAQSYEHRERTPGYKNLPVLLIANTYIGTARSMEEKDRPPPDEQVEIAAKHKVLVLRTIDLLNLLRLCLSKKITQAEILKSLLERVGWWRVEGSAVESKEKGREA